MNNLIDFDNRVCVVPAGSLPVDLALMVTGSFYPVDVVTSPVGGSGGTRVYHRATLTHRQPSQAEINAGAPPSFCGTDITTLFEKKMREGASLDWVPLDMGVTPNDAITQLWTRVTKFDSSYAYQQWCHYLSFYFSLSMQSWGQGRTHGYFVIPTYQMLINSANVQATFKMMYEQVPVLAAQHGIHN